MTRDFIVLAINGKIVEVKHDEIFLPLGQYLRKRQLLTGTKIVCAEGDCGACSVLKVDWNSLGKEGRDLDYFRFDPVNSCILPMMALDGASVVTVEGLAQEGKLHPAQESMVDYFGSQCGYCTPGIVCTMVALAEKCKIQNKPITEKRSRNALTGNLCRCTGYKDIIEACTHIDLSEVQFLSKRFAHTELVAKLKEITKSEVRAESEEDILFIPCNLERALQIRCEFPQLRLIAGATDVGVIRNKGKDRARGGISLHKVEPLKKIEWNGQDGLFIGSMVTLSELERALELKRPELGGILKIFAGPQIKNQGTVCGNLLNGSPIGDLLPFFVNQDSTLHLAIWDKATATQKMRVVSLQNFYLGYKEFDINPQEMALGVEVTLPQKDELVKLYKVSLRKDLDISSVTMASYFKLDKNQLIEKASITYGGVGPTVKKIQALSDFFKGRKFEKATFDQAAGLLGSLIQPISDLRASKEYRMAVAKNLLIKSYEESV